MNQNHQEALHRFKEQLVGQGNFETLFECFSDIYFFVKDRNYKLLTCNEASLRLFNLKDKSEVMGKTEYDFFPKKMADPIHEDDVLVIEQQQPIINRMELIVTETDMPAWVSTTKLPLLKIDGSVAGLMGTTRIIQHPDEIPDSHKKHAKAVDHIRTHFHQRIRMEDLARMCHLSISQFRESFTKVYKMSPQKFILKLRIQIACRQLSHTDTNIATLAQDCGFCDQSYFTRQFSTHVGLTPLHYRAQYTK